MKSRRRVNSDVRCYSWLKVEHLMRVSKRAPNCCYHWAIVSLLVGYSIFGSNSVAHPQQTPQVINGPPVVYKPLELRRVILNGNPFVQIKVSSERIGLHMSSHGALFYRLKIGDVVVRDIGTSGVYSSSLIFTISIKEFASMKTGQTVSVLYGDDVFTFCCLNKKSIKRKRPF
jgi:hypothetical protein